MYLNESQYLVANDEWSHKSDQKQDTLAIIEKG